MDEHDDTFETSSNREDACTVLWSKPPTLEEAQDIVGGYVEMVELRDLELFYHYDTSKIQMLVDEEGIMKSLPINETASRLSGRLIRGPALFLVEGALWK